jgi:hypothetical protein
MRNVTKFDCGRFIYRYSTKQLCLSLGLAVLLPTNVLVSMVIILKFRSLHG